MGWDDRAERRRAALRKLAEKNGWSDELGIASLANALGREFGGVNHDLSHGFPKKWIDRLRKIFGGDFDEADWVKEKHKSFGQIIHVRGSTTAAEQILGDEVSEFLCIRAPNLRPKLPKGPALPLRLDGLVDFYELARNNPPLPFLKRTWSRVQAGEVSGKVVNAVGRIGALAETWASAELIRKMRRHDKVSVHLLPTKLTLQRDTSRVRFFPVFGARVVNRSMVLLSVPADEQWRSKYSSIIVDNNLAEVVLLQAERLIYLSYELTGYDIEDELAAVINKEFEELLPVTDQITQYGKLDTFDHVRQVKDRIVSCAQNGQTWLPPLA